MSPAQRELTGIAIWSLENRPADWIASTYTLTNPKLDIEVWVGNGLWAVRASAPGISGPDVAPLLGWFMPWRWRLWRAAHRAAITPLRERFHRYLDTPPTPGAPA